MATILLIEDNLEIRENTTELLELAGYDVLIAMNGKIGVEMAISNSPDIILCDIMMPELNGYEVFSELKKNEHANQIPFVFITASVEKSEMRTGLEMGAAGYIRKPFEENDLLSTIVQCLKAQ